ncbi:lactoylglutathione lyase family protein /glyoxalase I family protein [Striga asiatica]|uniref:Lactoylglutathione lyase n=1 Tax=Striga asiatica TaxID=4170 RepID=A0A5A7PLI8_STRAF|nr:lactoylglutathione lyase family protein /glyoxalase I family protein [Striga asiatica]
MAQSSKESAKNNPGLQTFVDRATKSYFLHHTVSLISNVSRHMVRIKDPRVSLDFYSRIMGMSLLKRLDFADLRISNYYMGYEDTSRAPIDPLRRTAWAFSQRGVIELTHMWGTETDRNFTGYHNGNTEPLGYGHIGINVGHVQKAINRFESLGVQFVQRIRSGNRDSVAFIQDPDGYWIEIFDTISAVQTAIDNNSI